MTVREALLRSTKFGLCPDGDGWFVLNVLEPGEPMSMYHRENKQEGFLVLAGECILIVEGESRPLKTWDFFHCPGGTGHVIVGAGYGPAVVLAVVARGGRKGVVYEVAPAAIERGAGVDQETTKSAEAYTRFPSSTRVRYRDGWLPDGPD